MIIIRKYSPLLIALTSVLSCVVIFRFYLTQSSHQFAVDFEKQNLSELNSSDVFSLATRLNQLSSSYHWVCAVGYRGENEFYRKTTGACGEGLFQTVTTIIGHTQEPIEIRFTFELPKSLQFSFVIFVFFQGLLLFSLNMSAKAAERKKLEAEIRLGKLAAQLAHDIRSPLAALNVIEPDLQTLPEDARVLLRSAIGRIRDIANNLLDKDREFHQKANHDSKTTQDAAHDPTQDPAITHAEPLSEHLLSSLIDPLITEKRMQYRSQMEIEIEANIDATSYGLFANIQPTEFKRVLSNLINNSVEALEDVGKISLSLSGGDHKIQIQIQDNGKGIPPEILEKIGKRGESHGKVGGSGLGLYHARTSVQSWGGELSIQSNERGTTVIITLPSVHPPEWFVSEIKLLPNSTVIILDDDSSIHHIWRARFESLHVNKQGITVHHFSTPEAVQEWFISKPVAASAELYLLDFELLGQTDNGLDLSETLGITKQSILVTSRFEESKIRERCQKLGVKLIPKGLAGFVPIKVQS